MTSLLKPFQGVSISFSQVKSAPWSQQKGLVNFCNLTSCFIWFSPALAFFLFHQNATLFLNVVALVLSIFGPYISFFRYSHDLFPYSLPCYLLRETLPDQAKTSALFFWKTFFLSCSVTLISFLLPPLEFLVSISVCSALETVHHILYWKSFWSATVKSIKFKEKIIMIS